jgi:hypothetical protein
VLPTIAATSNSPSSRTEWRPPFPASRFLGTRRRAVKVSLRLFVFRLALSAIRTSPTHRSHVQARAIRRPTPQLITTHESVFTPPSFHASLTYDASNSPPRASPRLVRRVSTIPSAVLRARLRARITTCPKNQIRRPLFSYSYKLLPPQPACFDIDTNSPGGVPAPPKKHGEPHRTRSALLCQPAKRNSFTFRPVRTLAALFTPRAKINSFAFHRLHTIS